MDPQAIRITIELPQGADVQASGGATGDMAIGAGMSASRAIDAGPPPSALVAALGGPARPATPDTTDATGATTGVPTGEAIDAGAFPDRLATEMDAAGPRHPFGHPETGTATTMAPVMSRESRN